MKDTQKESFYIVQKRAFNMFQAYEQQTFSCYKLPV